MRLTKSIRFIPKAITLCYVYITNMKGYVIYLIGHSSTRRDRCIVFVPILIIFSLQIYPYLTYPLVNMALTASIYMTVVLGLER